MATPNIPPFPVPIPPVKRSVLDSVWSHTKSVRVWLHGLVAAVIGGTSTTLGAHFADPAHVDLSDAGRKMIFRIALSGALVTVVGYFAKSPLPVLDSENK